MSLVVNVSPIKWSSFRLTNTASGKRIRCTVYGATRKEVTEKLRALQRQVDDGVNVSPNHETVEQFMQRWLDEVIVHKRPRTLESYQGTAKLHIYPHVGSVRLQQLKVEHVQRMVLTLVEKKLGARSIEYAVLVLSRALNCAIRWERISKNVARLVQLPEVSQHKLVPLTIPQAQQLLQAVKGERFELIYRIALSLGLRRGEVLGLQWGDIDFEAKSVTISGALQRQNKKLNRTEPKTRAGHRTIPLPAILLKMVLAHRDRQRAERAEVGARWLDLDYVFTTPIGTPVEPRNLNRHFKEMLIRAKLPDMRFHDLRHSAATLLIAQGVHARVIAEILGHTDIRLTMNLYGHVADETQRHAVNKLDTVYGETPEKKEAEDAEQPPEGKEDRLAEGKEAGENEGGEGDENEGDEARN